MGLARLALAADDAVEAERRAGEALGHNARDPEALLMSFLLANARGGDAAAQALAAQLRPARRGSGRGRRRGGRRGDGGGGAGPAAAGRRGDRAATGRRRAAAGEGGVAAGAVAAGRRGDRGSRAGWRRRCRPRCPRRRWACWRAIWVAGRDSDLLVEVEEDVAHRAFRSWVDVLRSSAVPEVLRRFRHAAPAVAGTFPWLEERVAPR